ncbi:MAG: Fe-S cluster assembly ATPase SufC [Acidobacteria bacterium 21-70-11]|nr:MAG: Fe-S cluster assembly ATPase SufC [Acidobacteria bacterium 21-70-11]OYW06347.1 MAG: Fe-S cluster assembly ATPase SufC [Acidobacteria bacterium 37-71-11]HQU32895.1 Fe-S cluster assembly ATPase SufC [Thermoanaerobaculaceae bacterium]
MNHDSKPVFSCAGVRIHIGEKEVVKGVDLTVQPGEVHAIMGPNGSGKSTLANGLMGHPAYAVEGTVTLAGEDVSALPPDEKARRGMFLAFQYPVAVPGVTVASFLRAAVSAVRGADVPVREFRKELLARMADLEMDPAFAGRYLNDGFSGGEKKRVEILQLLMLKPKFALLDETDSGLDIDALKVVAKGINAAVSNDTGMVLVTHYQRLLNYVRPDVVHVFMDGHIVRTGGPELALELEERGYDWLEPAAAAGGV